MERVSELRQCQLDYRAAALNLAAEAMGLADALPDGSDELIDRRFAHIRLAFARCKSAHTALRMEAALETAGSAPGRDRLRDDLAALRGAEKMKV